MEIGRTHMTVGETLDLRVGSVVTLERLAGETADLLVNGTAIARGEVVVVDEQYGLRITEILDAAGPRPSSRAASGSPAPPAGDRRPRRATAAPPRGARPPATGPSARACSRQRAEQG